MGDVFKLDLSLKQSILDFCAKVRAGHDKIHVFINNAALVANPQYADEPYKKRMSADGKHEITMATNYIGHCILNEELLDLLKKGGEDGDYAWIVVVSSLAFMLASQMQKVEKFLASLGVGGGHGGLHLLHDIVVLGELLA